MIKATIVFVEEVSISPDDFWPGESVYTHQQYVREKEYATFDEAIKDIGSKYNLFDYTINTENQEITIVVWL